MSKFQQEKTSKKNYDKIFLTFKWKISRIFLIKLFPAYNSINDKHRPNFAKLCNRLWSIAKYDKRVRLVKICPSKSVISFFETFKRLKLDKFSIPSRIVKKLFSIDNSSNLTSWSTPWKIKYLSASD